MRYMTYPLNNIYYRREDAEAWLSTRTSGVYLENDFDYTVTGDDTQITIGTGRAWIHNADFAGKVFLSSAPVTFDCGIVDNYFPRYDVVAIRFSATANKTEIVIKKGRRQAEPRVPRIEQNELIYELYLYRILRKPGTLYISRADITDLRLSEYCGLMASTVDKIDTRAIQKQIEGLTDRLEARLNGVLDRTGLMLKAEYDRDSDGIVDKIPVFTTSATFTASGWSGSAPYTQKVSVSGLTARDTPIADVSLSGNATNDAAAIERFGNVGRIYTEAGSVTAVCYSDKPRANFTVKLMVIRGGAAK